MEVEALEKKGHTAFAKAMKSFSSSERYKRSKRLVSAGFCIVFCSDGNNAQNVIKRFLNGSYFEDMYATDALRSSDKTIVLPMPVNITLLVWTVLFNKCRFSLLTT